MQTAHETRSLSVWSKWGVPVFRFSYWTPNITTVSACNAVRHPPSLGSDVTEVGALSPKGGRQNHNATISIGQDEDWISQKQGTSLWFPLQYRLACYGPQVSYGPRSIGVVCPVLIELCVSDWVRNTSLSRWTLLVCSLWGTCLGASSRLYDRDGIICKVHYDDEETVDHRIYNTSTQLDFRCRGVAREY
jgi:hypothetical protein